MRKRLKRLLSNAVVFLRTGMTWATAARVYRDLGALYYREWQETDMRGIGTVWLRTMAGGVQIGLVGRAYDFVTAFVRHDRFNDRVYLQVRDTDDDWKNVELWDREARPFTAVLRRLARHNPFEPSDEGVVYVD